MLKNIMGTLIMIKNIMAACIVIKNIMATSIMLTHQEVGFTRDKVRVQDGSKHQVFF